MGAFERKSIDELRAQAESSRLTRALGAFELTALGVGAIIGAGIFVLTGQAAAEYAGPAIVFSFLLAGFACLLSGLCFAELASMMPVSGGAYTYAYASMGQGTAWLVGWTLILEYSIDAAAVAVGWSGYLVSFLRDFGVGIPAQLTAPYGTVVSLSPDRTAAAIFNVPAALLTLILSVLLVVGIRVSTTANTLMVGIKVGVIVLFIGVGAAFVDPSHWMPLLPPNTGTFGEFGWSGVLRGAAVIFVAYLGFDAVSTASQEARNPKRDVPIGMLGSLAICAALYIATALVLTGLVPYQSLSVADPIAVGIDATGVRWLRPVVKLGALAALSSVALVLLLGQARIFLAMSHDGLLPRIVGAVHPRFRTPHVTTAVTGVVVAILAGIFSVRVLAALAAIGTLFCFVIVCLSVVILRHTAPKAERTFRTPASPWIPVLGAVVCTYLMIGLPGSIWLSYLAWLLVGVGVYCVYGHRASRHARVARSAR